MQNKFIFTLVVFFGFILFIYMPLSYLFIYLKDRKGKIFEKKYNAVKFYVKHSKIGGHLSVHSINGEKPIIHRNMKRYGYYVLPGKNIIHVQYQWVPLISNLLRKTFGLSYIFGIKQYHIEDKKLTVTVKPNVEYVVYYDHNKKDYVFEEEYNK